MNFYKHFIGDYQRDTGHLSLMEHGAYRLMLDTFYATQKPLPKDRRTLYRLLRAESAAERKAIDLVISQFWLAGKKGLVNLRAETEIGKAQKQAEVNRQIAHAREEKRRMAKRIADAGESEDRLFSGVLGCKHGSLGHPENQVYGVSRADGSSMPNEKQAINGANIAKNANKDAFMAMTEENRAFRTAVDIQGDVPGDMADVVVEAAVETIDGVAEKDREGDKKSRHADMSAAFSAQDLALAMRAAGVEARPGDPRIMALAHQGISPETVAAACEEAKRARPDERIGPAYVVRIVERWAKDAASITAHGAVAHGKASQGGAHMERKRVMEGLTGWRADGGREAFLTIEGRARVLESSPACDRKDVDDDGFYG
ncbi:YdaU family protein [Oxalobacter vibrioformis]|uniref:YdaU family protein n=1 Tax=Oxalobacter vibrioformis TaxID=933080 RepID=A0A9E9P2B7_9BURK|nr:YdaU family protein [Oxalobacter vibrioformis]WAW09732.1 YdaU family protein [Oxalobacter vibrioformis]